MTYVLSKLFYLFCHQIPARSPHFQQILFPLCYRCAGLYGGIFIGYLFLVLGGMSRSFPGRKGALATVAPLTVFLLDAWANGLGFWDSPGWWRALSGLGAGLCIPVLLLPLIGRQDSRTTTLERSAAWIWPAAAGAGFLWMLDHPRTPQVFEALALACALGCAACLLNLAFALREYFYERRACTRTR